MEPDQGSTLLGCAKSSHIGFINPWQLSEIFKGKSLRFIIQMIKTQVSEK
jgi:hypothetical protein